MEDAEKITARLFSLSSRGIKFGLEKTREAARLLGNPHSTYPCFHVAGTNGKGSVCAFIESMLRAHGTKTGLFTSPHLIRFEERFLVNGVPVATEQWMEVYRDVEHIIDDLRLTFFEAATIMAFEIFRREKVDWAVFETGMGGRLDATNIVIPRVSVIAALGLDHREFLGPDLLSIALEKFGIIKEGVPVVLQEPSEKAVLNAALSRCAESNAACHIVKMQDACDIDFRDTATFFRFGGRPFVVNIHGAYQVKNAVTAIRAMEVAGFTNGALLAEGLRQAVVPGRFHKVNINGTMVVFDVAHNPQAMEALYATLRQRFPKKAIGAVVGIMKDKDTAAMVEIISQFASSIIFTKPATDRAADPNALASHLPCTWSGEAVIEPRVGIAVRRALSNNKELIVITGSFFTVGEAMRELNVEPYPVGRNSLEGRRL